MALVAASALVTLLTVEVIVHVVESRTGPLFLGGLSNPEYNPGFVQPHPVLGVEHVPGGSRTYGFPEYPGGRLTLRSNSLGLREDGETARDKPDRSFRVLVLGDSQTDGLVANHESFVNVAERELNERYGRTDGRFWELLNAGVITYQPVQAYLWWRTYGRELDADGVLLVLYSGNDLLDASRLRVRRSELGNYEVVDEPRSVESPRLRQRLLRSCRLCVLASLTLRGGVLEPWLVRLGLVQSATDDAILTVHRLCRGCMWQSLVQPYRYAQHPEQYEEDLSALEDIVAALAGEIQTMNVPFGIVILPSKLEVEGDIIPETAEVAARLGLGTYMPAFEEKVRADMLAMAARNGWPVLDATDALRSARSGESSPLLYYQLDWHMNVLGHEVVGSALVEAIGHREGLLPPR